MFAEHCPVVIGKRACRPAKCRDVVRGGVGTIADRPDTVIADRADGRVPTALRDLAPISELIHE